MNKLMNFNNSVEDKVISLRNQSVILDSDVASIYGVETKRINEAVSNNPEKFPAGYIQYLTPEEWRNLKSKISTSSWGGKNKLPKAFTEKGLYMLATILKSPIATQKTIEIIETFTKFRELGRTVREMTKTTDQAQQKSLMQRGGELLSDLIDDGMQVTGKETSFELNLAMVKIKHTVKQEKKSV
jgi:hypothetical protein